VIRDVYNPYSVVLILEFYGDRVGHMVILGDIDDCQQDLVSKQDEVWHG